MDALTFISNLIRDLAWPVTTLIALIFVIKHAPSLAGFVKAVRFKDFELTLREEFTEARAEAEQVKLEAGGVAAQPETRERAMPDKIKQLVEIDPAIAIIEVWRTLEAEIVSLIQHNAMMRFTTPEKFIQHLVKIGKLTASDWKLYQRLRQIRNTSVHAPHMSPTLAEVVEFSDFVEVLGRRLKEIKSEPGYITVPMPDDRHSATP